MKEKILRVDLFSWNEPDQSEPDIDVWFIFKEGDKEVKIYSIEENEHYLKSIPIEGICGRLMKRYYLKDGMKFMEELKFAFHGSRVRASKVYEIPEEELKLKPKPEEPEAEEEEIYEDFGEDEFLDGAVNILKHNKLCFNCIHIYEDNHTCKAFPNGIPIVFITGQKMHTKPSKKYNQKNDIVWTYDKDQIWIKRQWEEEAKFETKVVKCGTDQNKANRIYKKLEKEGWNVNIRHWDEWPPESTIYASRKKK